jgi:hypothetical protein
MSHITEFGTAAMLALLENRQVSIAHFAMGEMTTVRRATTRLPSLPRSAQSVTSDFFLLKHPQKHQQIRMSSPQTT